MLFFVYSKINFATPFGMEREKELSWREGLLDPWSRMSGD
jgi:hypothetical protein